MTDLYKEQYKRETEQIHAPAALIARTKAAVREEEARILQGISAQAAESDKGEAEVSAVSEAGTVSIGDRKYEGRFGRWKWAYPLTAAAALLILVSVSMTMRGLKSENKASDSTSYEGTAAETESAQMSGGADSDGGVAAGGITVEVEEPMEAAEEIFADEEEFAEADMAASEAVSETEDVPELSAVAEDAVSEEPLTVERGEQERKLSKEEKDFVKEEALPVENGVPSGSAADAENITIERVEKKPDFCKNPDIETYVFAGEAFQIAKTDNQWAAYVETKEGNRYVLRGEADDVDTFLETGYQKLLSVMSD